MDLVTTPTVLGLIAPMQSTAIFRRRVKLKAPVILLAPQLSLHLTLVSSPQLFFTVYTNNLEGKKKILKIPLLIFFLLIIYRCYWLSFPFQRQVNMFFLLSSDYFSWTQLKSGIWFLISSLYFFFLVWDVVVGPLFCKRSPWVATLFKFFQC